jgi:hypothetical protein
VQFITNSCGFPWGTELLEKMNPVVARNDSLFTRQQTPPSLPPTKGQRAVAHLAGHAKQSLLSALALTGRHDPRRGGHRENRIEVFFHGKDNAIWRLAQQEKRMSPSGALGKVWAAIAELHP